MSQRKWKSPLVDWQKNNQDPNLAFTLVARNEAAKQMWADPHNGSMYIPASFIRRETGNQSLGKSTPTQPDAENVNNQLGPKKKGDTEPALRFLFNAWPKDSAKGFVLGSCDKLCDVLLGDTGDFSSEQTLAFTFNEHHELIMNVTSDDPIRVKFNGQKGAERNSFTWICPRGQEPIRVSVADLLEFDIVLPKYGINDAKFHENCEWFLSRGAHEDLPADGLGMNSTAITRQASGTSGPQESFYLRGKKLGSGSYGDVYKALRMPNRKVCAAKRFKDTQSFRQEVDMLKKVGMTDHKNIVQFVEEWHGDYKPLLIMEYVAGGSLVHRMSMKWGFQETADLANQTLAALVFLHEQGVMHRDIKPSNILCVTPNHYKLADFGVSREIAPLLSRQGTAEYMAPEVYDLGPYSYSADIWSLGVVLLECMFGLPGGYPGASGRKWYQEVFARLMACYQCYVKQRKSNIFGLIQFIKDAMLQMDADERLSARDCLESFQDLQESFAHTEDRDARSGSNVPIQVHRSESFYPNSHSDSDVDEADGDTSGTVRRNTGATPEEGREPQIIRNEDKSTVTNVVKAEEPLLRSLSPHPPSFGGEENYDPSNLISGPPSIGGGTLHDPSRITSEGPPMSESGAQARSTSDASVGRGRDSDGSEKGVEEDGSVTPGRRAPYHPGNEVASPGLGYFPPSPWVSSRKRIRSAMSEP